MSEAEEGRLTPGPPDPCRYCGKTLRAADPEHKRFWPFCCERCRMAELGLWLEGRYVLSRPVGEVADDAATTKKEAEKEGDKT